MKVLGLVHPGALVFDVGANIGNKAASYLALGARVVCFEPQPACAQALGARLPAATVEACALGRQAGEAELMVCDAAPTISTFVDKWRLGRFRDYTWSRTIRVPVATLDAMIEKYGTPDYTKIDVEGFELEVLAGLSRPLPCVSVEFHSEWWEDARACVARLGELGARAFNVADGESEDFALGEWVGAEAVLSAAAAMSWGDIYGRAEP
jgi:FkbM family methyltransferase